MELLAVRTARLIAYINVEELNPAGRPLAHNFMNAFVERYSFIKRPTTAEEILDSEDKGVNFEQGKFGDVGIEKAALYSWGIVIGTNSSTDDCEAIIQDFLKWGAEEFGLSNRADLITKRSYISEIVFRSNVSLLDLSPHFKSIGANITALVAGYLGTSLPFEPLEIALAFDSTQSKQLWTPFRLQRLLDTAFSENKYYLGGPFKTADHLQLINDFEASLKD